MNYGLKSNPYTVVWTLLWIMVVFAYLTTGGGD